MLYEAPYVIGQFTDTLLQLNLSLRVLPKVRELLGEFVVAIDKVLDQSAYVLILFRKIEVDKLGLHLC